MKLLLAVTLTAAALMGSAGAADKAGIYTAAGAGARSCADYNTASPEALTIVDIWMEGYVTALNQVVPDTKDVSAGRDGQQLQQALAEACRQNPQLLLADAANLIVGGMVDRSATPRKAKKAKKAKPAPAPVEEAPLELRR